MEQRSALNKLKWKSEADPDLFFEELATVQNQYAPSAPISDDNLIATAMEKAPKKYSSLITTEVTTKKDSLTLDDLQIVIKEKYRLTINKAGGNTEEDDEGEMALNANDNNIECHKCKKYGHKDFKCTLNKNKKMGRNSEEPVTDVASMATKQVTAGSMTKMHPGDLQHGRTGVEKLEILPPMEPLSIF